MIIRTTFKDNDYTDVLEEYWSEFAFNHYYLGIDDIEDLKEYRDKRVRAEELIEKAVYKPDEMTEDELKEFKDRIVESIKVLVTKYYGGHLEHLSAKVYVDIVPNVEDKWENGEVVYYFLSKQISITM